MGIRFADSILSLLAASCFAFTAYFFGHGLSEKTAWPFLMAAGLLSASLLIGWFAVRRLADARTRAR